MYGGDDVVAVARALRLVVDGDSFKFSADDVHAKSSMRLLTASVDPSSLDAVNARERIAVSVRTLSAPANAVQWWTLCSLTATAPTAYFEELRVDLDGDVEFRAVRSPHRPVSEADRQLGVSLLIEFYQQTSAPHDTSSAHSQHQGLGF
jgi:hypothetical protein